MHNTRSRRIVAAVGQGVERQQDSGGVVVHHHGRDAGEALLVEQACGQPLDVHVALAALAGGDIELQIAVNAGDFADAFERGFGQRRASQVGVQDYSRGIDHRTQRGRERLPQPALDCSRQSTDREFDARSIKTAGSDLLAQGLEHFAGGLGHRGTAFSFD